MNKELKTEGRSILLDSHNDLNCYYRNFKGKWYKALFLSKSANNKDDENQLDVVYKELHGVNIIYHREISEFMSLRDSLKYPIHVYDQKYRFSSLYDLIEQYKDINLIEEMVKKECPQFYTEILPYLLLEYSKYCKAKEWNMCIFRSNNDKFTMFSIPRSIQGPDFIDPNNCRYDPISINNALKEAIKNNVNCTSSEVNLTGDPNYNLNHMSIISKLIDFDDYNLYITVDNSKIEKFKKIKNPIGLLSVLGSEDKNGIFYVKKVTRVDITNGKLLYIRDHGISEDNENLNDIKDMMLNKLMKETGADASYCRDVLKLSKYIYKDAKSVILEKVLNVSLKEETNPLQIICVTWSNWGKVCDLIPKKNFVHGVYLDDETLEELPEDKHSNTMGVVIKNSKGEPFLIKQGEFIFKKDNKLYISESDNFNDKGNIVDIE